MDTQKVTGIMGGKCRRVASLRVANGGNACAGAAFRSGVSASSPSLPSGAGTASELPAPTTSARAGQGASIALAEARSFLPGLVEHYLAQPGAPKKQEMAVLFVDIADSTSTILRHPPEVALAVVQRFTRMVTDIALAYRGDVKDYEGDGALLYFRSLADATRAALAIRTTLGMTQEQEPLPIQARLSLNVGEIVIGEIGSPLRRSIALIGPAISLASRLLKHIPPGGIIAPQTAVAQLSQEAPDLAQQFQLWGQCMILKGFEEECVTAFHIPPPGFVTRGEQALAPAVLLCSS